MTFIWPTMLLWLLLLPPLILAYIRLQQRRRRLTALYGNHGLAPAIPGRRPGAPPKSHRHIARVFSMLAPIVLILAVARPQTVVGLPRLEGTIILTFDVSGSMAADDLKPTRLEAAKAAARQFVQRQPSTVQIGV